MSNFVDLYNRAKRPPHTVGTFLAISTGYIPAGPRKSTVTPTPMWAVSSLDALVGKEFIGFRKDDFVFKLFLGDGAGYEFLAIEDAKIVDVDGSFFDMLGSPIKSATVTVSHDVNAFGHITSQLPGLHTVFNFETEKGHLEVRFFGQDLEEYDYACDAPCHGVDISHFTEELL